jgi:hypothetical protein
MSARRRVVLGVLAALVAVVALLSTASFELRDEVVIDAAPEAVWAVLIDFPRYAEWNHQLTWLGGTVALGETLSLRLSADGAEPYEFAPTVTVFEPNTHFAWLARTGLPRVFDGNHHFELQRLPDGKTRLVNWERYSGVLAPVMQRLPMMANAPAGFVSMNADFKRRAERKE